MQKTAVCLLSLAVVAGPVGVLAQQRSFDEVISEFALTVATEVEQDGIGGITAGVVVGSDVVWKRGFGWSDKDARVPADGETVYRVGSISKSVTAVLLMLLVQDGVLHLDDSVALHFPTIGLLADRPDGAAAISYRQLASHTAGLIREPRLPNAAAGPIEQWEEKVLASIPTTSYQTKPGEQYSYSNIGFGILGLAISRAAAKPFMELVVERIFEPLDMNTSVFVLTPELEAHLATGYANGRDSSVNAELPSLEHHGRGYKVPNGGVYSTVDDLAKFIAALTGASSATLLTPESRSAMLAIQTPGDSARGYGLGFSIQTADVEGTPLVMAGHGGSVAGYNAYITFDQASQLGVIMLRNYNRGATNLGESARDLLRQLVAAR
jgi:CubicO group peptidase (beta-lactamase class C family)